MTPQEVIKWLRVCSSAGPHDCEQCPYNREPYEAGCGRLLSDAALLLSVVFRDNVEKTEIVTYLG